MFLLILDFFIDSEKIDGGRVGREKRGGDSGNNLLLVERKRFVVLVKI